MAVKITLPHNFAPRPYQVPIMDFFDHNPSGRACWVVHRRGGKDLTLLHQTIKMSMRRVGQYWHVYPMYAQARKAIWNGFRSDSVRFMDAFPRQLVASLNKQTMTVELKNGSIWTLVGSDNVDSVVGSGPCGIVFSEFAICNPSSWDFLAPILVENKGWAAFISTPRGKNHFYELFHEAPNRGWFHALHAAKDTGVLPADIVEQAVAQGMPRELALQEYECDWNAAPSGTVWGDLLVDVKYDSFELPSTPIYASWDLGHTDATAVWFWAIVNGSFYFIDYYEANRKPLKHYFGMLKEKDYPVTAHYLPHDARAHTLASSSSVMEQFIEEIGIGRVRITPNLDKLDGIQAARWMLQQPCVFHHRTRTGVKMIQSYRYAWSEEKKVYSMEPVHDWASNGSDAFRYAAVVARPLRDAAIKNQVAAQKVVNLPRNMYSFTLNDLWENCLPAKNRRM